MNKLPLAKQITNKMNAKPKNTIYTNSDFYDLNNPEAVRKSLSRLCKDGIVHRLIDGYYTIPYYVESIKEYSYPSANELANKIANRYAWTISPCGDTALNLIGLSTQVPNIYEFISDGPYREFEYLGQKIQFKHTTNRSISNFSKPLSLLIQSIKSKGEQNISNRDLKILSNYCKKHITEDMIQATKDIPVWIYKIVKKVSEPSYE